MGKGGGGGEEGIAVASGGPLGCSGFRRENGVHLHDASGSSFHFPRVRREAGAGLRLAFPCLRLKGGRWSGAGEGAGRNEVRINATRPTVGSSAGFREMAGPS